VSEACERRGTYGDLVGVEHHVVGEAAVVHEGDLLALRHGEGGGLEHERAGVGAQLDGASVGVTGQQGEGEGGRGGGLESVRGPYVSETVEVRLRQLVAP
jgi:hypothetical protein